MTWPSAAPPPTPAAAPSRGWALAALWTSVVAGCLATLIAIAATAYAFLTLITGAPPHVQLTTFHYAYLAALPLVGIPGLVGLILAVVALAKRPRAAGPGRRDGTGAAIAGLSIAGACLVLLALASQLLAVEPCWEISCG